MRAVLLLVALLPLGACATPTRDDRPDVVCPPSDNWQVWIDVVPDPVNQLRLTVDGEVTVPPGMVARLRPGGLDKSMPPGQRFVLELRRGKGPSGPQRVRGEARPAYYRYREVIIVCGGEAIARIDGGSIETAD